jgi:hypothetical protein
MSLQKFLVAGLTHMSGISKAGNPYTICTANILQSFRPRDFAQSKLVGCGLSAIEMSMDTAAFPDIEAAFKSQFKGNPVLMEFDVGLNDESKMTIYSIGSQVEERKAA